MKRFVTMLGTCCAIALVVGCSSTQTVSPGAMDTEKAGCAGKADCGACPHAQKEGSTDVAPGAVSSGGCTKAEGTGCCAKKASGGV